MKDLIHVLFALEGANKNAPFKQYFIHIKIINQKCNFHFDGLFALMNCKQR